MVTDKSTELGGEVTIGTTHHHFLGYYTDKDVERTVNALLSGCTVN